VESAVDIARTTASFRGRCERLDSTLSVSTSCLAVLDCPTLLAQVRARWPGGPAGLPDMPAQTPFDAPWLDHDNDGIAREAD
jgi:hypothetical protein